MPFWLSPTQAVVCTIAEENNEYVNKLFEELFKAGIKCEVDLRNEKINYKIRDHSLAKIPIIMKREKFIKNMLLENKLPLN